MSTWKIDPAHTEVSFSAKHMMVTTVRGSFRQVEGSLSSTKAILWLRRARFVLRRNP